MLTSISNFLSRKFRRLKIWALVVLIIALIATTCTSVLFLTQVVRYGWAGLCIEHIEQEAAEGTYTANGLIHWTDDLTERGKAAREAKDNLIQTNDVCRWLATSAESTTGKVVRAFVIALMLMVAIISLYMIVISIDVIELKVQRKKAKEKLTQANRKMSIMQG